MNFLLQCISNVQVDQNGGACYGLPGPHPAIEAEAHHCKWSFLLGESFCEESGLGCSGMAAKRLLRAGSTSCTQYYYTQCNTVVIVLHYYFVKLW